VDAVTALRVCLGVIWAAIIVAALYCGIRGISSAAWWSLAVIPPPLIVLILWLLDRAALEHRIKRLEARSEIGDERRVIAGEDITNIEQKLGEIQRRIDGFEAPQAPVVGSPGSKRTGSDCPASISTESRLRLS